MYETIRGYVKRTHNSLLHIEEIFKKKRRKKNKQRVVMALCCYSVCICMYCIYIYILYGYLFLLIQRPDCGGSAWRHRLAADVGRVESGMMRKRSSSGSSGSSSRVQRSQEVMPHQTNYPYQQQQLPPHYSPQTMHHTPGGAVAAAGRLVRQTSRDSNDGSLHSVSSESSS